MKKGNFYMIRLVASDIDGTLLQGGARALSDELFGLIRVLKKRGILFCAASGRQYRSMRALFAQAEDDIAYLCENGAIVYRGGSVVSKLAMERADALALIGQIQAQEQCEVLISGADTSYLIPKHPDYVDHIRYFVGNHITRVKRAQDIPEDILKVSAYCRDGAASHAQTLGAPWKAAYSVAVAGEKWLDFTRADKGTGLAALCGELGVRPQEVIAFGDNFNDVPMLDLVGSPYIMQGAVPALLERYQRTLGFYSCTVPAMEQYTLARFLSEGYFETHVNRMRGFYRGRRDQVLDALSRSPLAGRYQVRGEDAGLHFLLRLETERDDRSLARAAEERQIRLSFLSDYGGGESHVLVVSYPGIELARLPEALAHLAELL